MNFKANKDKSIQRFRTSIQLLFIALCLWIGIEFSLFVSYLASNGVSAFYQRPPGVEGFLPISSLMSVLYFFKTGEIHSFHPAGFFIFIAIFFMSLFFAKSFCSWLCPIGFLSDLLSKLRMKITKKRILVPVWLDYPLRSLKYLLLGFLLFIVSSMSTIALSSFLNGGYNIVCDIRMYDFFAQLSLVSVIVILILIILSFLIDRFWCRYLCPYGALLGITGLLSPIKVKRNAKSCIDCGKCTKVCPANINVAKSNFVLSDECTSCAQCIDVCPVNETLNFTVVATRKKVNKKIIGFVIVGIFIGITGIAMLTGHWHNHITKATYLHYYKIRETLHHH
jgi:NapH/MauN family ferredoxin-type protein